MYSLCVICPKWKAWSMRFRAHEIYSSQNYATYCPFLVSYKSVQLACILLNFIFTCCCRLIYSFAQILPWHIQMDICSYYRYRTPPQSARRQASVSVVGHYCCGTHFLNGWMHRPFVQRHRSCEHWTVPAADRHLRYMMHTWSHRAIAAGFVNIASGQMVNIVPSPFSSSKPRSNEVGQSGIT